MLLTRRTQAVRTQSRAAAAAVKYVHTFDAFLSFIAPNKALRESRQHLSSRSVYISSSVTPQECNCEHMVVARLNLSTSQADSFCPRCKCTFQSRNLTVIKVSNVS